MNNGRHYGGVLFAQGLSNDQDHNIEDQAKLVLVDESGDMGHTKGSSQVFVISATVTDCPMRFRSIAYGYEKNTRSGRTTSGELKYYSSSDKIRLNVLRDIARSDPDIWTVVIHKGTSELSKEWDVYGRALYRKAIETLMDDVMKNVDGPMITMFDPHTALRGDFGIKTAEKKATHYGRNLICAIQDRTSHEEAALQIHDFVVGSTRDKYEHGKEDPYSLIASIVKVSEKGKSRT
ncbi:MAG: DUF3800 domain-containing protein [Candidatus Methanoplasma sp.]|jgi:hypothetical protein|nr:DUF3800 domain-containing protein [Candidatus Methanoplasma sp.]